MHQQVSQPFRYPGLRHSNKKKKTKPATGENALAVNITQNGRSGRSGNLETVPKCQGRDGCLADDDRAVWGTNVKGAELTGSFEAKPGTQISPADTGADGGTRTRMA